jgi:hypothetical protein
MEGNMPNAYIQKRSSLTELSVGAGKLIVVCGLVVAATALLVAAEAQVTSSNQVMHATVDNVVLQDSQPLQ